jgi:hypothetical protein
MNMTELLKLVDAGFTKQEILQLAGAAQDPKEEPKSEPAPQPEPAPAQQEPQQTPQPAYDMSALLAKMEEMTKAVQASNIAADRQPKQETADDILAAIIRPPRKE